MPTASKPHLPRQRDIRLDFFRGAGMFIIFIAHIPNNLWAEFIPARIGFSDATEIFVFCSGMASAIAFGKLFEERGFVAGTSRIAFRCWQVYWAHIGLFFTVLALMIATDKILGTGNDYVAGLNLVHFTEGETATNLLGLMTLTYVPNLFDILPMYLVILCMIPIVMALSRVHTALVFAFMAFVWWLGFSGTIELPAEPWSDRPWYFNPFAWQLVFFTGFAFMRGWIPAPPIDRRVMWLCAGIIVVSIPLSHWHTLQAVPTLMEARQTLDPIADKTHFGPLRYIHFLAIAYLAYALAGEKGANIKGAFTGVVCKVGQQALGVFMAGITLSMLGGVALNLLGRDAFTYALVNLTGCALLIAVAYIAAYFKSTPWQKAKPARSEAAQAVGERERGRDPVTQPPPAIGGSILPKI